MKIIFFTTVVFLFFSGGEALPQKQGGQEKKVKKGLNLGVLPAISYNSDLGFQYGGLVNLYDYGDGSGYPAYKHSLYVEMSRYTKGSGINRLYYDSEHLLKNIRVTSDISYLTEKTLDFYGFNGYQSVYNAHWEDDDSDEYRSRMFYRHDRKMFRFFADFQGKLPVEKLRWIAGFGVYTYKIAPVDIEALNKGKDEGSMLPDIDGLYERYVQWGIIPADEKDGGDIYAIKAGIAYDTRDNYPNPMTGIWTEMLFSTSPTFLGNKFGYTKMSITHRQYFTLIEKKLSFVYRLGYQGTINGHAPFFVQPEILTTYLTAATSEGLGGSRSLRGVLRNRVVGDAFMYGNFEFRWKFLRTTVFKQNIYLALNTFLDAGKVISRIYSDPTLVQGEDPDDYIINQQDKLHKSAGAGLRLAMNENFIVAADYGRAFDARDGKSGFYIALNFLF